MRLLPLLLIVMAGCSQSSRIIVLNNLPPRISIERDANMRCSDGLECVGHYELWDKFCSITLRFDATIGTLIHELAHCAGANEKEADEMAAL